MSTDSILSGLSGVTLLGHFTKSRETYWHKEKWLKYLLSLINFVYIKSSNLQSAAKTTLIDQVAELMAVMAKNRSLSYCKVVEVVAETTAPLTPMEDLLAKIPPQRVEVSPPKVISFTSWKTEITLPKMAFIQN